MSDWTFATDQPVTLDVRLNAGRFDLETGEAGPVEISMSGEARSLEVSRTGQTIVIRQPRGFFSGRIRLMARVPVGSNLELAVGAADVSIEAGCDEVLVTGASGDIRIDAASRVRVASASGDIRLGTIHGDVSVSAASADVFTDLVEGDLEVSLASGDVRVAAVGGNISASTASGDVRIGRCDGSSIELRSISGDLDLGLPSGIRVDADLNTTIGRITIPERETGTPPPTRSIRVSARTTSGDIRIRRA